MLLLDADAYGPRRRAVSAERGRIGRSRQPRPAPADAACAGDTVLSPPAAAGSVRSRLPRRRTGTRAAAGPSILPMLSI